VNPASVIWKFPLGPSLAERIEVEMPRGARLLDVQAQKDVPCIWALVDPAAEREKRVFWVAGTGHALPRDSGALAYCGTFQLRDGEFVFHLFEEVVDGAARRS